MPSNSNAHDLMILHRILRYLASRALQSFFTEVRVVGGENVPVSGPIIVTATHHNMMLDPVVLSSAFPHGRMLNYWSKASLYKNPVVRWILLSTGNIPVDRKSSDRQILFKGTFEALSKGAAVALFPEGTSYTEPRIMQVKDGAAWAALEFCRWLEDHPEAAPSAEVVIIPASIVYTNKSKYRSDAIMEMGKPISMDEFKEQFFSTEEGASRAAVKRLTRKIEAGLVENTINAPNWDTLYAARMARDLMWEQNRSIPLEEFVPISQTLVDLFSTLDVTSNFDSTKRAMLDYYSLLQSTNLTNSVLSSLPVPRNLHPNSPATLPSRLYTLLLLIRDTAGSIIRLPFFVFPLLVHMPVYLMGQYGAKLVEDEEETQAQNKVVFGMLSLMLIYPAAFFFLWAMFWYTSVGAMMAFATVYLFARYHTRLITENYESAKRIAATWRVLIGIWAPKRWEFPLSTLSYYTIPLVPKANPWVEKPKPVEGPPNPDDLPAVLPPSPKLAVHEEPPVRVKTRGTRRPPSRRIMRHVLRTRVEAVKALATFFDQLERAGSTKTVHASVHLASLYGSEETGVRYANEVISFLRKRGAKIPSVTGGKIAGEEWAVTSDTESELDH